MSLFEDRSQAGRNLSEFLKTKIDIDLVVIPYEGAFDIGLEIARDHDAEIEILLSDFIYAPNLSHADIGAVVEDRTLWIEDKLVEELNVDRSYIAKEASRKAESLRKSNPNKSLKYNKTDNIVIASEGLGSGFREAAVAGSLLKKGYNRVFVAAPFRSRNMMADLEKIANGLFYLNEIPFLSSADSCYKQNENKVGIESYKY